MWLFEVRRVTSLFIESLVMFQIGLANLVTFGLEVHELKLVSKILFRISSSYHWLIFSPQK